MKNLFVLLPFLFSAACAFPTQVLVDKNWKQADCSTWGFGGIGSLMAVENHRACENKFIALGYVKLEEAEKLEPPKLFDQSIGPKDSSLQPLWPINSEWIYSLKGSRNGTVKKFVLKKDVFESQSVYVIKETTEKEELQVYVSETLGIAAIIKEGNVNNVYKPPLKPLDWPLQTDKKWEAVGEMKTPTGTVNLHTKYYVKGFGKVIVPAGTFDVFYIMARNDNERIRIAEYWYSPKIRNYVKYSVYVQEGVFTGELVSYNLGE